MLSTIVCFAVSAIIAYIVTRIMIKRFFDDL